tara:strand:+ start:20370 stop:21539 length:1170 start_codon:yes stop_codon:yes gene_type:complete
VVKHLKIDIGMHIYSNVMKLEVNSEGAQSLYLLLHNLSVIAPVVSIRSDADGMQLQGMDSCQVCLFDCKFNADWFNFYSCPEESIRHLNSKIFATILKMIGKDQSATVVLTNSELIIAFTGGTQSCDKDFTVPLVAYDYDFMDIKEVVGEETTAQLCMTSKKFLELVTKFELFDQVLTFSLSEEVMKMSASGEMGSMSADLDLDGGHLLEYSIIESSLLKQSFSHRFVKNMASFGALSLECELLFYDDRPMFIVYKILCPKKVAAPAAAEPVCPKQTPPVATEPVCPKQASTAYQFYCDAMKVVKAEDYSRGNKDVTIELAEQWKALADDDKEKYVSMEMLDELRYGKEKTCYDKDMVSYKSENEIDNNEPASDAELARLVIMLAPRID